MSQVRCCQRCGSATVDIPPVEVNVTTGQGWGANSRAITLCHECGDDFESFLLSPPRTQGLDPHGEIGPTVDRSAVLV